MTEMSSQHKTSSASWLLFGNVVYACTRFSYSCLKQQVNEHQTRSKFVKCFLLEPISIRILKRQVNAWTPMFYLKFFICKLEKNVVPSAWWMKCKWRRGSLLKLNSMFHQDEGLLGRLGKHLAKNIENTYHNI